MHLFLAGAVSIAVLVPAAQSPTRAQLPEMVVPDAALRDLAGGLPGSFAFFSTAVDAAASTIDPNDTGADLKRLRRVAGYVRGRNTRGAFSDRGARGLQAVGTSVTLFRDAPAADASIQREVAAGKRFNGKVLKEGVIVSFRSNKVPSFGSRAVMEHLHARSTGGSDRFGTAVLFRVGQLRGFATVSRGDRKNADRLALALAEQLRRRIVATLRHG